MVTGTFVECGGARVFLRGNSIPQLCGLLTRKYGETAPRKPEQDAGDGPACADQLCFWTQVPPEDGAGGSARERNEYWKDLRPVAESPAAQCR